MTQTGCVAVDGGAVEFSWAVRSFDGSEIGCVLAKIDTVSLCWRDSIITGSTECLTEASSDFRCDREQGATSFSVPSGEQTLWIEVSCATTGARADRAGYEVPAPIVRTVTNGGIVTLNSLLIVASDRQERCGDRPCTCPP